LAAIGRTLTAPFPRVNQAERPLGRRLFAVTCLSGLPVQSPKLRKRGRHRRRPAYCSYL
jgi:hypothetical protein